MTEEGSAPIGVDVRRLTTVRSDGTAVVVSEVETPKGERLQLETEDGGARIRLDAVALESLTWQDEASFDRLLGDENRSAETLVTAFENPTASTSLTQITNEFGHVNVRELDTPDGSLLELDAQNMAYSVQLNAAALAAIAGQSIEVFGTLIREQIE
ncbi:MAG: hypothetical protein ABEH59_05840 [Halobacteriales archaeon]